jgi:outer membrane lipoprotein-sorting protein
MALAALAGISCACGGGAGISTRRTVPPAAKPVMLDATRADLIAKYNAIAAGTNSIDATVDLKPTAGSQYSGVIEEYHDVKAFLLAERPAQIRVLGQAPVIGTNIFDMASDGQTFRVSIPSKNKFITGPVNAERASSKPIENLRPQHLLDALLWPEIRKQEAVLFEEFNDEAARYYVLTVLRGGYETEILRKIWFDRANLQIARLQTFGPKGVLLSDIFLSDWEPVAPVAAPKSTAASSSAPAAAALGATDFFPRTIRIDRPHDDYRLDMQVSKIALNEAIPAERFELRQPDGAEVVHVGASGDARQP